MSSVFGFTYRLWTALPRSLRIVLSRLALLIPQMFGVLVVTFFLVRALPGDPVNLILGNIASPEAVERVRAQLGLDKDIFTQFILYCEGVIRGDWGVSAFTSNPVLVDLSERTPATLELLLYSLILMVLFGITVGVLAAKKPNGFADLTSKVYGLAAGALPDFWVGLILIYLFFTYLGWAPAPFGRLDPGITEPMRITGFLLIDSLLTGDFTAFRSVFAHLILPVATITLVNAGLILKHTHSIFSSSWKQDYVFFQRGCGVKESLITRSALRNSLPPIITMVGFLASFLLGAAVLVETIFSWGGLGQYAVNAVANSDYAALQGFILIASAFTLIIYMLVDIFYELIDPRITI